MPLVCKCFFIALSLTDGLLGKPTFWPSPLSTETILSLVRRCDCCGLRHAEGTMFCLAALTVDDDTENMLPPGPSCDMSVGSVLILLSSLLSVLAADSSLKEVVIVAIDGYLRRMIGVWRVKFHLQSMREDDPYVISWGKGIFFIKSMYYPDFVRDILRCNSTKYASLNKRVNVDHVIWQ